jgi:hypothetical protein
MPRRRAARARHLIAVLCRRVLRGSSAGSLAWYEVAWRAELLSSNALYLCFRCANDESRFIDSCLPVPVPDHDSAISIIPLISRFMRMSRGFSRRLIHTCMLAQGLVPLEEPVCDEQVQR